MEAFTAMRHEYRMQVTQNREIAELVERVVANLQELEANRTAESKNAKEADDSESRKLAEVIAQIDTQLTHAISAIERTSKSQQPVETNPYEAVAEFYGKMNFVSRQFARPLFKFVQSLHPPRRVAAENSDSEHGVLTGLNLLLAQVRGWMNQRQLERVDTPGESFDGSFMKAIGSVESDDVAAGCVAEQLSPCYRWRGDVLLPANVMVAK